MGSSENVLKSQLVLVKMSEVDDEASSEERPIFTDQIKVRHGVIIARNPSAAAEKPDYLVIPAKGQWREKNHWIPHKNWKPEEKKSTYDPKKLRIMAEESE